MKILHTSDWHLGHKHYGRARYQEFSLFLDWLATLIQEENIETLLIAGDVFDSQTPSNRALESYYGFLSRISHSPCRHVIIVGGNHDSPTLLNAPRDLLRFLNIHVIGRVPDEMDQEIILLRDKDDQPELMVLAVPYLRDRDLRSADAGESRADKEQKLLAGIRNHYSNLYELARQKQKELASPVPLVAMGHLFCQGGTASEGDGIRDLYVGSLAHVGLDCFPSGIDYLALGHLHLPQKVKNQENRRYSGAPLVMGFNEAQNRKCVVAVTLAPKFMVEEIPVPCFQALQTITGDLAQILKAIERLKEKKNPSSLRSTTPAKPSWTICRSRFIAQLATAPLKCCASPTSESTTMCCSKLLKSRLWRNSLHSRSSSNASISMKSIRASRRKWS